MSDKKYQCEHCGSFIDQMSPPLGFVIAAGQSIKTYVTVKQITKIAPWLTEAAIRAYIFSKDTNGFAACVKKIGRKVLIDLEAFQHCIENGIWENDSKMNKE